MKGDLEISTFQKRPAYRYIRASDHIPGLEAVCQQDCPLALIKLFNPTGQGTWYIAGYDPDTRIAYGAADIFEFEYGDFAMAELVAVRARFGLPLERDLHWTPRPLNECKGS